MYDVSAKDELSKLVLDNMRKTAPLFEYVHFFYQPGGSALIRSDADVNSNALFRTVAADFASKADAVPSYASFALKILGKTMRLDRAYEERGGDVPSEMKRELGAFGQTLGRNLSNYIINGDATQTPSQFNGLKKTVAALAASQTLTATGVNGLQVLTGVSDTAVSSQQKLVEALQVLIGSVANGAQLLVMNSSVWGRLSTVAAALCNTEIDKFGHRIMSFAGVPVVHAGYNYDGSEVLPQTETKGTSTDCTSVYALRSDEQAYFSLMTTKNGLKVYDMVMNGNFYETTVELQADSQVLNARSIAVLPGVRLG
jgi:hypothetical protein